MNNRPVQDVESDARRLGRHPVLLLGLVGLGVSLVLFALFESLPWLYLARFLNGLFTAAVAPAAYALVGDHATSKEWRAHRFTLLNVAGTAGFFVGPLLGSLALRVSRDLALGEGAFSAPFLAASGLTLTTALITWGFVSEAVQRRAVEAVTTDKLDKQAIMLRLGAVAFVSTLAIGAFEVGLSLRGKQNLGMDAYQIGILCAECSIVTLVVQALVFSPLIKPDVTRWFLTPGLVMLALGLALIPLVSGYGTTTLAVALIAASAGILLPIVTFWVSLVVGKTQGADLGRITAAASLGQAVGSAAGGLLFDVSILPNATFNATAVVVLTGLVASWNLPRLLAPHHKAGNAGVPTERNRPT